MITFSPYKIANTAIFLIHHLFVLYLPQLTSCLLHPRNANAHAQEHQGIPSHRCGGHPGGCGSLWGGFPHTWCRHVSRLSSAKGHCIRQPSMPSGLEIPPAVRAPPHWYVGKAFMVILAVFFTVCRKFLQYCTVQLSLAQPMSAPLPSSAHSYLPLSRYTGSAHHIAEFYRGTFGALVHESNNFAVGVIAT